MARFSKSFKSSSKIHSRILYVLGREMAVTTARSAKLSSFMLLLRQLRVASLFTRLSISFNTDHLSSRLLFYILYSIIPYLTNLHPSLRSSTVEIVPVKRSNFVTDSRARILPHRHVLRGLLERTKPSTSSATFIIFPSDLCVASWLPRMWRHDSLLSLLPSPWSCVSSLNPMKIEMSLFSGPSGRKPIQEREEP